MKRKTGARNVLNQWGKMSRWIIIYVRILAFLEYDGKDVC